MAKILVIDDDKFIVAVVAGTLKNNGHAVEVAYDGEAGEQMFDASDFDVVICDMLMPRQEGIETIRHMRRAKPDVAIVAMSGGLGSDFDVLAVAKQLGAHVTLAKPFHAPQIIAAVDEALACVHAGPAKARA
jgi:two-component system, chemotaxis family, chemotaxis protein CheY